MTSYDYGYRGGYGEPRDDGYGGPGYYAGYGPGYGYTGWGTRVGPGARPDRGHRRRPEESPAYGRGGDRAARNYARSRGYDVGYTVQPSGSGRFQGRPRARSYSEPGGYGPWGDQAYRGWNERDYDWGYRW